MHEGEDRGRGANTQGERDHRGSSESGCFSELPKRFLQIRHFVSLQCVWCRPVTALRSHFKIRMKRRAVSKSFAALLSCNTQQNGFVSVTHIAEYAQPGLQDPKVLP
jgi:hypothetical protein